MGQIGTIRVDTQSNGTVSVPVFDTGDSGSDVYEFVRVQTESGTGFIPVEDTSNAAYPYLRVKSQSHGTVAMTDRSTKPPDTLTEDLFARYDASTLQATQGDTINAFPDTTGNHPDLVTGDNAISGPTYDTNTFTSPGLDFTEGDPGDYFETTFNGRLNLPFSIFLVYDYTITDSFSYIFDSNNQERNIFADNGGGSAYYVDGGTVSQSIISGKQVAHYRRTSSEIDVRIRHSGTTTTFGNSIDGAAMDDIYLNSRYSDTLSSDMVLSELIFYEVDKSANETEIEDFLIQKYGI